MQEIREAVNIKSIEEERRPGWVVSLIPFLVLVLSLFLVIRFFGSDALAGGSQVSLVLASAVAVAISMFFYKVPWSRFEQGISENIKSVGTSLMILFLIGAISGSWMISGVVPTLICYGMKIIHPAIFLFASCLICALVSLMTGSSWTTIATLGVALIGIGSAQGYDTGWTAGAIISGAYFGDKISPLSDTTVLASSSTRTPLFEHIRYMMLTTMPSFVITLLVFLFVSIFHKAPDANDTLEVTAALKSSFNVTPWTLVVPVLTAILILKKLPALLTLFLAALMAGVMALILQPDIVATIGGGQTLGFESGFKGTMISYYGSTAIRTGNEMLDSLVATRGMNGMMSTVFLILCAVCFGGTLTGSGMMQSLTDSLTKRVSSRVSIVSTTALTGLLSNAATGDQYLSIILSSNLYRDLYRKKGYESRLLSRTIEDSTTVTSVLIPWNSCGMTQSTVLKVATLDYLPYCLFNLISPLMTILVAALGFKIYRKSPEEIMLEEAEQ